jgi:hypothetical protein
MFPSIKSRLRQLWQQCDLFDASAPVPKSSSTAVRRPHARPGRQASRPTRQPRVRIPRTHPKDKTFAVQLTEAYERYNAELFGNALRPVPIRVSRRMKNRLGHYMMATKSGLPAEIAISLRHIHRDPWEEVLHTLVHEMVHQWQDEKGLPIDHGRHFRAKAREVGISDRATRRNDRDQEWIVNGDRGLVVAPVFRAERSLPLPAKAPRP